MAMSTSVQMSLCECLKDTGVAGRSPAQWLPLSRMEPAKVEFLDTEAFCADVTGIPTSPPPGLQLPALLRQEARVEQKASKRRSSCRFQATPSSRGTPSTSASSSPAHSYCRIPSPNLHPSAAPDFRPPPGLEHIRSCPGTHLSEEMHPLLLTFRDDSVWKADAAEGISEVLLPPATSHSVEWPIQNVFGRLKTSCGCPLVSPGLEVGPFTDLRLHFVPGDKWTEDRRAAKTKGKRPAQKSSQECKPGSIRLKLGPEQESCGPFEAVLQVGDLRLGPFKCDFDERSVLEFPINCESDWCQLVEADGETLPLRVEISRTL